MTESLKQCLECKQWKPRSEFPPYRFTPDQLNDQCTSCVQRFRQNMKDDPVMMRWQKELKKKRKRNR